MARVMEIGLRTTGIGQASGALLRLSTATQQFGGALNRIGAQAAALKSAGPTERQLGRLEKMVELYERLAEAKTKLGDGMPAIGRVGAAQARVADAAVNPDATPAARARVSEIGKGTAVKLQEAEQALTDLEAAGTGTAAELRDARVKVARLKGAFEREERLLNGPAPKVTPESPASRIGRGPRELMAEIRSELARDDISTARRGDLEDRLFRAERSVVLNERRRGDREESLNRPGLLELFGDLNSILKDIRGGDVLGVAAKAQRTLGFQVIPMNTPGAREREGGLNIEQLLAVSRRSMLFSESSPVAASIGSQGGVDLPHHLILDRNAPRPLAQRLGLMGQVANRWSLTEFAGVPGAPGGGSVLGRAAFALRPVLPLLGVAAGATAAAAALVLMAKNTKFAAERLSEIGAAAALSGGSASGVNRLSATGISEGAQAGLAAQLRERLGSDPMAIMAAGRFEAPRPFGGTDELTGLEREIGRIRSLYNESASAAERMRQREEQLRQARMLGLEAVLPQILASDRMRKLQLEDAALRSRLFTRRDIERAREFNDSLARIGYNLNTARMALGKPLMPIGERASNIMANNLNRASAVLDKIGPTLGLFADRFVNQLTGGLLDLLKMIDDWLPNPAGKPAKDPVIEQLEKEYELQVRMLKALEAGLTGGGTNAGRAVPGRYRGKWVDDNANTRQAYYGGITV